jgi:D-aspartate ligase
MMSKNRAPAVVLAGDINGLGVVRSLDEAGIRSIAVTMFPRDPVLSSRLPWRKLLVPPARPISQALLQTLSWVSEGCVLIPTSDENVSFMVENRTALARQFAFCLPPSAVLGPLLDKQHQAGLVEGLGLPAPRTVLQPQGPGDERLERLRLPVIFKPRSFAHRDQLGRKNVVVETAADRDHFLATFPQVLPGLVAQEVIPGEDDQLWVCNCTFDANHALVSAFTFQRLGLAPAHFGVTSYAISQRNDVVIDLVARLGRAIGYVGPMMAEFKLDERDHEYKFIELNPRLGMCNTFDTACGVNNVLASYQLALGQQPTPPPGPQRDGVMFLSFIDDLHSRHSQGQSLSSVLRTYARNAGRQHVSAYFRWHDPGPAAAVAVTAASRVIQSLRRKNFLKSAIENALARTNVLLVEDPTTISAPAAPTASLATHPNP